LFNLFRRSLIQRLEWWEFQPSADHRSLVLTLYRSTLKELLMFKSVRRKSLTMHCRLTYRRRSKATEKLLVDECVEEARRAVYVLTKHNNFAKTGEFEFDSMYLPKDTGQDVSHFMEETYDPAVAKQHIAKGKASQDVVPGKEDLHMNETFERQKAAKGMFKSAIRDEDKMFRPPAPPTEGKENQ
jgi:hypothetical protein